MGREQEQQERARRRRWQRRPTRRRRRSRRPSEFGAFFAFASCLAPFAVLLLLLLLAVAAAVAVGQARARSVRTHPLRAGVPSFSLSLSLFCARGVAAARRPPRQPALSASRVCVRANPPNHPRVRKLTALPPNDSFYPRREKQNTHAQVVQNQKSKVSFSSFSSPSSELSHNNGARSHSPLSQSSFSLLTTTTPSTC